MPVALAAPAQTHPRTVAIIAQVDHGKLAPVDGLLKPSSLFREPDATGEQVLDVAASTGGATH